ncbi:putative S-layer protein [Rivularia sp. PCC 7116]|uniref:S-layer homology domain-containing protein n=1 Tax=Rivularia sp. PCC 7116 TaxID=373994 RepID=UPI00029F2D1B|nr:S-layer homology domain-containing protein [Rivularia sp. PCC 7116]AFY58958.1 putative S-layer protein [Rivularia sp. PCC 7116]
MNKSKTNFYQRVKQALSYLSIGIYSSIVSVSMTYSANAQTYSDINGHWAEECIQNLSAQGILSGYSSGIFRPNNVVSRAEYAAMITKAFPYIRATRPAMIFNDVSSIHWAKEAINNAYTKRFLSGYPNQVFNPTRKVTRVEAFVALATGLNYSVPSFPNQILNAIYDDSNRIPEYARGFIAAATQQGILITSPKPRFKKRLISPSQPVTRGQIAAALCQVKQLPGVANEYVVKPNNNSVQKQPDDVPINLGQTCTNKAIGYTVSYPLGWQTNSGDVLKYCQVFDFRSIQLRERSEDFDEAVYFDLEKVPFERIVNARSQGLRVISRQETTVGDRRAVVTETESTGMTLLPKGIRSYKYLIDFNDKTLVVVTYEVKSQNYPRNKKVVDKMIESIKFSNSN